LAAPGVSLTRLSQLACAAADVDVEWVWDDEAGEERPHQRVTLKAPSWKVDALLEIMAERPGQPVVAFAPGTLYYRRHIGKGPRAIRPEGASFTPATRWSAGPKN
jgi:hypothetical protein